MAATLTGEILRIHAARASSASQAKAALQRRVSDLSQQASRTLIQRQMAQQVARWLNAPPPVADVVTRVMEGAKDPAQGLRQVHKQLTADPGHRLDAAEVQRVLEKLSGVMDGRWR